MKKLFLLSLLLGAAGSLFAADNVDGNSLTVGQTASLDVETATTFAVDLSDGSTGLDTNVGIEFVFDLIPRSNKGLHPKSAETPTVRLDLENAAFTWWNTYYLDDATDGGGNWDQDDINAWGSARPLILTFDSLTADLVYRDWYFRVAGTKPTFTVNSASLKSIFDDVMDAGDRYYVLRSQALYTDARYNKLDLPLLDDLLKRDLLAASVSVSGMLGAGLTTDALDIGVHAGSFAAGAANNDNGWTFGLSGEYRPIDGFAFTFNGLGTINYPSDSYALGLGAKYLLAMNNGWSLQPFIGFDGQLSPASAMVDWETGGGCYLYWRGSDAVLAHRSLDEANVIPVGLSLAMNIDDSVQSNLILAAFEEAGPRSLVPNLGGFLQVEVANLFGADGKAPCLAAAVQLEYLISGKVLPYIREIYGPGINLGTGGVAVTDGTTNYGTTLGLLLTPFENFTIDLSYARTDVGRSSGLTLNNGMVSATCGIRL